MEEVSESEIVLRVLAGDKDSYVILIDAHKAAIYNLAYRLTGNYQEAEDLAQETFIRAYSRLDRFNPEKNFFTWLYTISLNLIRNHLKRKKREALSAINENTACPNPGPEGDLIETQEMELLQRCFRLLPGDFREIIALKYYQGLTFADISEILDISESAAKMRLYRGLEKLKSLMAKAEGRR